MAKRAKETPLHERYDRSHPLLRELVDVNVCCDDGVWFDALLTRVPGLGEEIIREEKSYKVIRVWHQPVDDDGRTPFGWHALVDATFQPEDGVQSLRTEHRPRRERKRKRRAFGRRRPNDDSIKCPE
jgi:hypothetical protein